MGEVWRARDRRIGRDVAVKVLSEAFEPGDDRVRRFEQEARAAGALNHPGLVTIYDVGTFDGAPYIVMELLEGQTLRAALRNLSLRKTLDYASQIAEALGAAHEKGIIHRDLKPENIVVTSDGRVKILDFGLAKLAEEAIDVDGNHPTPRRHITESGIVVGTPLYMSPEQVSARPLDHRTDIFSFGTILYEMLSGRRPFDRETVAETMTAILREDAPPLTKAAPNVPALLDAIVRRCLEKEPRNRFRSAHDLAFDLRVLPELVPSISAAKRRPYGAIIAAIAALALAGAGLALYRGRTSKPAARTYKQLTFADGLAMFPTLSPDGKTLAFVSSQSGNRHIYSQRVDGRAAIDLTSDSPADDSEPAFSPDGSQIAFRSERDGGGIFVMGATGESVRRLTHVGHNPSWSPNGTHIVIAEEGIELRPQIRRTDSELWIVDVRTGAKRPLFQNPSSGRGSDGVQPSWSPHGRRIAFWSSVAGQRDLWTIDPDAPQPKTTMVRVTSDPALHWNPVWSPDGRFLYFGSDRDGTLNLWRIAMDETKGTPRGAPEPLPLPATFSGQFAFSQRGDMAFTTFTQSYRLMVFPFDANSGKTGVPRPLFGGRLEILTFEPSPDQQSIAFTTGGVQEDVFVANTDGTRLRQLTNDAAKDRVVTWSPDGKTLYFHSNREGPYQIWSIRTDGSGLARVTDAAELKRIGGGANIYAPSVSPDGRTLAAQTETANVFVHLDRPLAQRLEPFQGHLDAAKWSPDGARLVGRIDGGALGLYSLRRRQVEKLLDHGRWPQWLPDSRRIVFFEKQSIGILDLDTRRVTINAVSQQPGLELTPAAPRLSRDGSTLYARQTLELGDIWLARVGQ
jgi:eukaryotic-like serine/threonine-protein kinase